MDVINEGINKIIGNLSDIEVQWKKQTILITGGAGFLGSWLSEVLVTLGAKVIVVDNLFSGMEENIAHLFSKENFTFIKQDVTELTSFDAKVDYIFHLASRASPFEFARFPIQILKANTLGILNILELVKAKNAKFLYTSTSEVYGNPTPENIPTSESYNGNVNPIGPRSCYDEAKRAGEAFVMAYILEYNLDARIIRIFNTYGPRIRSGSIYGRVIPNFVDQCLNNDAITVFGDGTQTRSFLYVIDQIEGLLRASYLPKTRGEVINIGNEQEIQIISLARIIKDLTQTDVNISFHPLPIDDPKRRCPDISKARELLNWEPRTNFETGLLNFINWYKKNKKD